MPGLHEGLDGECITTFMYTKQNVIEIYVKSSNYSGKK